MTSATWTGLPLPIVYSPKAARGESPQRPAAPAVRHDLVATFRGAMWPEPVHAISATGISLALDRRLDLGTELDLDLYSIPWHFRCTLPLRVVSTVAQPNGVFLMGGTFTRPLSDDEKRSLTR